VTACAVHATSVLVLLLVGSAGVGVACAMTYAHWRTYRAAMRLLEMLDILVIARDEAEALRREWRHRTDEEGR